MASGWRLGTVRAIYISGVIGPGIGLVWLALRFDNGFQNIFLLSKPKIYFSPNDSQTINTKYFLMLDLINKKTLIDSLSIKEIYII